MKLLYGMRKTTLARSSCNNMKRDKNKNYNKESAVNYAIHKLLLDYNNSTAKENRDRLLGKKKKKN